MDEEKKGRRGGGPAGGSGEGRHITGWLSAFCVFDKKGHWVGVDSMGGENPHPDGWPYVAVNRIHIGVCTTSVLVDDAGTKYNT